MGIDITLDLKTTRDARSTVAARGLVVAVVLGAAFVAHSASRKQPFVVVNMLARNAPLSVTSLRAYAPSRSRWSSTALSRALARERSRPRMSGLRPLRPPWWRSSKTDGKQPSRFHQPSVKSAGK